MQVIYNELSAFPQSDNVNIANIKITQFINTFKEARKNGFKKIRFSKHLHEIEISAGYTVNDWLSQTSQRNLKELLLGARTYPFIDDADDREIDEYFKHHYFFDNTANGGGSVECEGLAAAYIYDTLSIGFSGNLVWESNLLLITKINDTTHVSEGGNVKNIYSQECLLKQPIQEYIESISEIRLVESHLPANEKNIHFRDDHGIDVLRLFANKLVGSPYVISIMNSLPFNPHFSKFIRKAYSDGIIEIVLHWEDRGLGMVIQTTGRNLRETKRIAELLEADFSKR